MNKEIINFPAISEDNEPGKVTRWLVRAGDLVEADQVIAELETDKAAFELTAAVTGAIEELVPVGKLLQPGDPIAIIIPGEIDSALGLQMRLQQISRKANAIPGEVKLYAGHQVPEGWLVCKGQSLAVADYPILHTAIGYRFGGNGDIFNLPDLSNPENLVYIIFANFL